MISDEMVIKLLDIYNDSRACKPSRKLIQFVLDSLLEQLFKKYFGRVPKGIMNMRREINKMIATMSGEDKVILLAMKEILREYDEVFSKKYTKHDDILHEFLDDKLRNLVSLLVAGDLIVSRELATELGGCI